MRIREVGLDGLGGPCRATLLCAAIVAPLACAAADSHPSRSLRIVVSFPPGTTTDTPARTVAQRLGMVPKTSTPQQLAVNIRAEVARWGPIIKAAGIAQ